MLHVARQAAIGFENTADKRSTREPRPRRQSTLSGAVGWFFASRWSLTPFRAASVAARSAVRSIVLSAGNLGYRSGIPERAQIPVRGCACISRSDAKHASALRVRRPRGSFAAFWRVRSSLDGCAPSSRSSREGMMTQSPRINPLAPLSVMRGRSNVPTQEAGRGHVRDFWLGTSGKAPARLRDSCPPHQPHETQGPRRRRLLARRHCRWAASSQLGA